MMLRFSAFKTLSFCLRDCRSCANGITSSAYTFGAHVETLQRIIATVMLHRKPKLQSMPCELMTRCYHTLQSFSIKKHKVVHVYSVLYSIFSYFILLFGGRRTCDICIIKQKIQHFFIQKFYVHIVFQRPSCLLLNGIRIVALCLKTFD